VSLLAIAIIIIVLGNSMVKLRGNDNSLAHLAEISAEWRIRPFVDVKVQKTPCGEGYEDLWTYKWHGLSEGCETTDTCTELGLTVVSKRDYEADIICHT
jgi:hypothetical protein